MRSFACSFTEIVFFNFAAFSVRDSLLHICSNSSSCHNVFILLSLSGVTNLSLLAGVCATCILAYRCLQMKWWAAVTVVAIPSQKALFICHTVVCSLKNPIPAHLSLDVGAAASLLIELMSKSSPISPRVCAACRGQEMALPLDMGWCCFLAH